jgi:hypothetical protein
MRFTLFGIVWLAGALVAQAQSSPEEEAITEILLAKDSAAVEKHLPEQLRTALDTIDKASREQLLSKHLEMMKGKGLKVSESNDGQALVEFDVEDPDADIKHFELRTRRQISNGAEAVLVLFMVAPEKSWGDVEIWMKLEHGEWRVTELPDPNGYDRIDLENPETIDEIVHAAIHANEQSAIANLVSLVWALVSYSAGHSEMPGKIDVLGSPDADPSRERAMLIDPELASTHAQSGYKFNYQRTSIDSFQITAIPLDFGKSGGKNFFVDESRVIRFTTEDRPATANDPALYDPRR